MKDVKHLILGLCFVLLVDYCIALTSIHPFIYFLYLLYLHESQDSAGNYPSCEVAGGGVHREWVASPLQG